MPQWSSLLLTLGAIGALCVMLSFWIHYKGW